MEAKKFFGQNFITDKNLLKKIVSFLPRKKKSLVIEIGPGRGALTQFLVQDFDKVLAIEIDRDLENLLKETFLNNQNLDLIIGDVLEINLEKILKENYKEYKNIFLISNVPYYITSKILFLSFSLSHIIQKAVFMFQKEVAERITSNPCNKKYNNLTVVSNYYAKVVYEFTVNKKMFIPVPKVDSAIVTFNFLENKKDLKVKSLEFSEFVRKIFNNKRKTILNNLKNVDKTFPWIDLLETINVELNKRPEELTTDQFLLLYKKYRCID